MTQVYRLVFVEEGGRQVAFDLSAESCTPCASADMPLAPDAQQILVLPAAAALPFLIELPFSDPVKIARVLPQFVADLYVDVDESWLFSWQVLPSASGETACRVAGLAFPGQFALVSPVAGVDFRLAIPDVLLAGSQSGNAVRVKTPASQVVAIFSGPYAVKRLFSENTGLPVEMLLATEGIGNLEEVDVVADAAGLHARINALMASGHDGLDVSGYSRLRRQGLRRLAAFSVVALLLVWVSLWHFFVWLECRITERAAQRTRSHMQQAFQAAFPGVPLVEPLTQVSRSMAEIEKRLKEAAGVPRLPWQQLFKIIAVTGRSDSVSLRLTARDNGVRFNGVASNYAALEGLRSRLEAGGIFDRVSTAESRQGDNGITFSLEATWKK